MIQHKFVCRKCAIQVFDTNTKGIHKCPDCGDNMAWDLKGFSSKCGDYNHYSEALAINPGQIAEHKKNFPGIDVLPNGVIHFTSVKQQSDYCKKTGFEKVPQKIKNKGVRIA